MAYSNQVLLETMYGEKNVRMWADLNNDLSTDKINARVAMAISDSHEYIHARMVQGRYKVPFVGTAPKIIVFLETLYAGVLLYDARMTLSSGRDQRDQMSRQRKTFDKYIRQILCGQLKLVESLSGAYIEPQSYPAPFTVETNVDGVVVPTSIEETENDYWSF